MLDDVRPNGHDLSEGRLKCMSVEISVQSLDDVILIILHKTPKLLDLPLSPSEFLVRPTERSLAECCSLFLPLLLRRRAPYRQVVPRVSWFFYHPRRAVYFILQVRA